MDCKCVPTINIYQYMENKVNVKRIMNDYDDELEIIF